MISFSSFIKQGAFEFIKYIFISSSSGFGALKSLLKIPQEQTKIESAMNGIIFFIIFSFFKDSKKGYENYVKSLKGRLENSENEEGEYTSFFVLF